MTPISFPEQNVTYVAEGCGDLPVYRGQGHLISCWRPSLRQRFKILFGGRVWLSVVGDRQPPVWVHTEGPERA